MLEDIRDGSKTHPAVNKKEALLSNLKGYPHTDNNQLTDTLPIEMGNMTKCLK